MKASHKIYWAVTLVCLYLFALNLVPFIQNVQAQSDASKLNFTPLTESDGASGEATSVGDSVSFFVESPRVYGTIKRDAIESNLSLFNLIQVPVSRQGFNFFLLHIPFLGCFCFILLKGGKKKDEQNVSSLTSATPDWSWTNDFDANEYKSTSYCIWS